MQDRIIKQGNRLIVMLPRELDHHVATEIREEVDAYLKAGALSEIDFDFSETDFMDSSGIGMIMGRYRILHLMGGKIRARKLNKQVFRIFRMSGLEQIVEVVDK